MSDKNDIKDNKDKNVKNNKKENKEKTRGNIFTRVFGEYRAEFRKIVWPSRADLIKHTVTTIVISLLFGVFITLLDGAFGLGFTSFVGLLG